MLLVLSLISRWWRKADVTRKGAANTVLNDIPESRHKFRLWLQLSIVLGYQMTVMQASKRNWDGIGRREILWQTEIIVDVICSGCKRRQRGQTDCRVWSLWSEVVDAVIKKCADPHSRHTLDVSVLGFYLCTVVFHELSYELQQSTVLYQTTLSNVQKYLFVPMFRWPCILVQPQSMTKLMHKFLIHLLQSSTCTCFEQYLAHPQEVKLY